MSFHKIISLLLSPDTTCEVGPLQPRVGVTGLPAENEKIKNGHKLQFHCDNHFIIQGSQEIECLPTGKWSDAFPTCTGMLILLTLMFSFAYLGLCMFFQGHTGRGCRLTRAQAQSITHRMELKWKIKAQLFSTGAFFHSRIYIFCTNQCDLY